MAVSLKLSSSTIVLTRMSAFTAQVKGAPKGKYFNLKLQVVDADGITWSSVCQLAANSKGECVIPGGTMLGVNHRPCLAHCFQALRCAKRKHAFSFAQQHIVDCSITVTTNNEQQCSDTFQLRLFAPQLAVTLLDPPYTGKLYTPTAAKSKRVIICLAGFGGGQPDAAAAILASLGYPALALSYFAAPGLPEQLAEVPLELLANVRERLQAKYGYNKFGLLAAAKGAELALLAAGEHHYDFVIAASPSSYIFQCLAEIRPATSSWTLQGEPLPFVPVPTLQHYLSYVQARLIKKNCSLAALYSKAIAKAEKKQQVRAIAIPDAATKLLLFAGADDQVWPAVDMCATIIKNAKHEVEYYKLPQTGHVSFATIPGFPVGTTWQCNGMALRIGGTMAANSQGISRMWGRVIAFLKTFDEVPQQPEAINGVAEQLVS